MLKKITVSLLLIAIMAPSALVLAWPKKAEAQYQAGGIVSCLLQLAGILGAVSGAVETIMAVPVSNTGMTIATAQTASNTTATTLKECVLDTAIKVMANTMINEFTNDVVTWINNGFEGSPTFLTDPEGFFADIGDQVAGQEINALGSLGKILCSPFDFQIKISLGFLYSRTYQDEIRCRLSDVEKNVNRAFVSGFWGANGWASWVSVSQPSNNPYGVFIDASNSISQKMVGKVNKALKELGDGRGFLSQKKCVKWQPDYENPESVDNPSKANAMKDKDGKPICDKEEIRTPGSVIETQLNQTLGLKGQKLAVADSINQILDALINQGFKQMFEGVGLLKGASAQRTGGAYLARITNSYAEQLALYNVLPPTGIDCAKVYRISPVDNQTVQVWQGNDFVDTSPKITRPSDKTDDQYYEQISNGCLNQTIGSGYNQAIADGRSFFSRNGYFDPNAQATGGREFTGNLAIGKLTSQSSTFSAGDILYWADQAIDRNPNSYSKTTPGENRPWWMIDLSKDSDETRSFSTKEILKINIVRKIENSVNLTDNLKILVGPSADDLLSLDINVRTGASQTVKGKSGKDIVIIDVPTGNAVEVTIDLGAKNPKLTGPAVMIQKTTAGPLAIAEIKIIGTETPLTGPAATPDNNSGAQTLADCPDGKVGSTDHFAANNITIDSQPMDSNSQVHPGELIPFPFAKIHAGPSGTFPNEGNDNMFLAVSLEEKVGSGYNDADLSGVFDDGGIRLAMIGSAKATADCKSDEYKGSDTRTRYINDLIGTDLETHAELKNLPFPLDDGHKYRSKVMLTGSGFPQLFESKNAGVRLDLQTKGGAPTGQYRLTLQILFGDTVRRPYPLYPLERYVDFTIIQ